MPIGQDGGSRDVAGDLKRVEFLGQLECVHRVTGLAPNQAAGQFYSPVYRMRAFTSRWGFQQTSEEAGNGNIQAPLPRVCAPPDLV